MGPKGDELPPPPPRSAVVTPPTSAASSAAPAPGGPAAEGDALPPPPARSRVMPAPDRTPKRAPAEAAEPMSARAALIVLALFLLVPFLLLGLSNVPGVLRRAGAIVAPPTATPRPATAPFADTLLAPGLGWVESPECRFGADGLHVVAPAVCYKRGSLFADGAVAVDVKQVGGEVGKGTYGIAFRRPAASVFYAFEITSDGRWHFINGYQELTPLTTHPAIKPGLNVTNALEVRATGQGFDFYANGERVGTGSDPLYPSGAVGLTGDTGLDVVYANLRVTGGAP